MTLRDVEIKLSELFTSIQGEGNYAGFPTTFIRLFGCPLRCSWCDSKYTWDDKSKWELYPLQDILRYTLRQKAKYVCLTGGEPLADYNLEPSRLICERISPHRSISVETSGCFMLPGWRDLVESWVWDVKLPGSGMFEENELDELSKLGFKDQVKFVVKDSTDFEQALAIYKEYKLSSVSGLTILWAPVYNELDLEWFAAKVIALGENNRLSIQVHKLIWGEKRGK